MQQLSRIHLTPSGYGLHFPTLDADLHLPSLLQDLLGLSAWMTERGRKGGQSRTQAKQSASRANGKLGGRPRKPTST